MIEDNNVTVEIENLIMHFDTVVYWCVSVEEDALDLEADRIFLSKNIVTKDDNDVFTMPEYYAIKRGLI